MHPASQGTEAALLIRPVRNNPCRGWFACREAIPSADGDWARRRRACRTGI
jgi:hypothetical protein